MVAPTDMEIRVYDKAYQFEEPVLDLEGFYFNPRKNSQSSGELTIPASSDLNALLRTKGTRLVCYFRGELLMSGMVRTQQGSFIRSMGGATYALQGDWRMLENTQAWVNPGNPIQPAAVSDLAQAWSTGAQSAGTVKNQTGYYVWPSNINSAEAAIKHIVQVNAVQRLGRNITIRPNQDRGGDLRAAGKLPDVRFNTLAEIIQKITEWSGLVVDIGQEFEGGTTYFDVHVPDVYAQTLTPESGIVTGGAWSRRPPDATRVIVGGPGEEAERAFYQVNNTENYENDYGDIIEVFRDSTGGNLKWPDGLGEEFKVAKYFMTRFDVPQDARAEFLRYLQESGRDALAEGRATSSLDAELVETEALQLYGPGGLHIGDWINAESDGLPISGQIEEADITLTQAEGQTVTPVIGERENDDDTALWNAISRLDKSVRNMTRKR